MAAGGGAQSFGAAYQALRADPAVQFTLPPAPPPREPPAWLEALGRFVRDLLAPVGRFIDWLVSLLPAGFPLRAILWTILGLAVAWLCWIAYGRVVTGRWRLPPRREVRAADPVEEWKPEAVRARRWLEDADTLAGEGRFAEAVHSLLLRSIDDIAARRPALAQPSLTGRELASSPQLPAQARNLFGHIADLVERSLFGSRPVREQDWRAARQAFSELAMPRAWQQ